jgi:23S rRNA (uracil1939-C5)-methyltransferase
MKSKREPKILEGIEITGVAGEGRAIARHEGMVVFTEFVVPGDVVDIRVTKRRKGYVEGRVVKVHRYSERRVEAFCEHYGVCGGCRWQILPYDDQLRYKEGFVRDCLERIGRVEAPEVAVILGSRDTVFYRNKLEFSFSARGWLTEDEVLSGVDAGDRRALGFHVPGRFDGVIDIRRCWLQDYIQNHIRNEIRAFAVKGGLEFFDLRAGHGFLRSVIVRTSSEGGVMVIVVFGYEDRDRREELLRYVVYRFPTVQSVVYVINGKGNDSIGDLEAVVFYGTGFIVERIGDLRFRVGPKSFYQTNSRQAEVLYGVVREFAGLTGSEVVYDLYTGTGTIACFLARFAGRVVGVEFVEDAVMDARVNAELNGIGNVVFFAGDMRAVLTDGFMDVNGRPDVVITDPPRAGMDSGVVDVLLASGARRIVYVSCNPATMARDVGLMAGVYGVVRVQPVDMFPHTHHVECVVLLERV